MTVSKDGAPQLVGTLRKKGSILVPDPRHEQGAKMTLYTIDGHNTESGDDIEEFEIFAIVDDSTILSDESGVYDLYDESGAFQHRLVAVHISY